MARLRNCTTGEIIADRVASVTAPWSRAIGYLPRSRVEPSEGLWFDHCSSVHTLGMRAAIDVVFVDRDRQIVRVIVDAPRNRILHGGAAATAVIELGAGCATLHRLALGDRLQLE